MSYTVSNPWIFCKINELQTLMAHKHIDLTVSFPGFQQLSYCSILHYHSGDDEDEM
jgi:hypothetical protein